MAVQSIYRDMDYATNLIKSKTKKNASRRDAAANSDSAEALDEDDAEEESWTFVGGDAETVDDLSPDGVTKRANSDLKSPLIGSGNRPGSRIFGGKGAVVSQAKA